MIKNESNSKEVIIDDDKIKKEKIKDKFFITFLFIVFFSIIGFIINGYVSSMNITKEYIIEHLNKDAKEIAIKNVEPLIFNKIKSELLIINDDDVFVYLNGSSQHNINYINKNNKLRSFGQFYFSEMKFIMKNKNDCSYFLIYNNKKWYIKETEQENYSKQEVEEMIKLFTMLFNKEENNKKTWM